MNMENFVSEENVNLQEPCNPTSGVDSDLPEPGKPESGANSDLPEPGKPESGDNSKISLTINGKIKAAEVHSYNNDDHVNFNNLSVQIIEKNASVIDAEELVDNYISDVEMENIVYKPMRRSEYTAKKADADHQRDSLYRSIGSAVHLGMKHFNPEVRDAAIHVNNLMRAYGNVPKEGYDAGTASIDSFLTHIYSDSYAPAAALLGLYPWLAQLKEANDLFKTYVKNTMQEQIAKPAITMRAARLNADASLHKVIARIKSKINLSGDGPFIPFMEEYNTLATHYNMLVHENYGRLHVRIDISPALITLIKQQPYTGKPVFVIPEVRLRIKPETEPDKVTELVFMQDFTVSYKNNIGPGTATVVIRGIGKYRGEVITTFNITETDFGSKI
jgi:hypothetical protein